MHEARPLVAYCFAYVRRRLHSAEEVNANTALVHQRAAQRIFENNNGRAILRTVVDWTTYRETPFVSREKFRQAIKIARDAGADLLLGDIQKLIARTVHHRISECPNALDALDIDVWDASLGRTWQSMTESERRALVVSAAQTRKSQSDMVKRGLQLSRVERTATANANYKHGNRANRNNADQRARRHRDFVLKEMAKVPAGENLSPSALAAALNAAGIQSARGGRWTHNTAKDLIARIRNLPASSPTR